MFARDCDRQGRRHLKLEEPLPLGNFDIYSWCSDDETCQLRKAMNGVYFDKGKMIATNGHLLVVLTNKTYPKMLEGRILKKDGVIINARFPKYEKARPDKISQIAQVDIQAVHGAMRKIKAIREKEYQFAKGICKLGGSWFDVDVLYQFVLFMEYKGITTIATNNSGRYEDVWIAKADDGDYALVMPLTQGRNEREIDRIFFDCNQK